MRLLIFIYIFVSIIFTGCSDKNENSKKIINDDKKVEKKEIKKLSKQDIFLEVFIKDNKIYSKSSKTILLIFANKKDPYSKKLEEDITYNKELQELLKTSLNSYYININEEKRYKQFYNNQFMNVDMKTLMAIYSIKATPSIIFTNNQAKVILSIPGYMPVEQLISTIKFIKSKKYQGLKPNSKELLKALKQHYIQDNITLNKN
ncbi:thioredoxin-related protein, SoxW family [Malaciobacter halophilus]|nr:thioredoxin fold domain-containing protein [Malaciobacter halophilus]AXH09660.1 thioredoxin-related protein, SoxW family [Malaciobacter halophilus]